MATASRKRKLSSNFYDVGNAKRPRNLEQEVTLLSSNPYPDNFHVGKAISNGSCFFDSFRQGLEQQAGMQVTVKQLRNDCKEFAQNNPPKWFTDAIKNDWHEVEGEFVNHGITCNQYINTIEKNEFWGRPDIEGRILCEKYSVKLHVVENSREQGLFLHQLIDGSGSKNAGEHNKVDYDDSSVLHIINKGSAHFEPLLDINKSLAKQIQEQKLVQEQEDFQLAKKLQLDEILEYCNLSKDISERAEVEKRFDELLAKNSNKEIGDIVTQCVSDTMQYIKRSEEQNPSSLPRCGMYEVTATSHLPQQIPQPVKSC
ncbi:OTU domain-containing protein [Candidatus Wolbachia massiliensis]|uniref:hypothetical protein n=1 Tax=Candidatus Wolbachia massiliensis TaxID=1845000 RepID=UPI001CD1131F|nr:hypothetical protein [Candidatus Wolbachia massiliensis]